MTLWFETALTAKGWVERVRVTLAGGRITRLQTGAAPETGDERHGIAIPGLSNVHSHAFQRGMAGLAEIRGPADDNFWTWREVMYRFLDRLTPEHIEAITAQAYAEMLEHGITRVGEFHYVHRDPKGMDYANVGELAERVAAAARETGIGLTLLPVFYAHSNFGSASPAPGQRRFLSDLDGFARLVESARKSIASLDNANLGVAPHSLRAVTPAELSEIISLMPDGPIHIHAAEQTKEVDDCVTWSGERPVEWLMRHANVDRRWCLVHATHVTPDETRQLATSGAVAGLCPITEANLGDGIFPADSYLAQHGRFGIGSDSNIQLDPAAELRALEYAQRLTHRSRNVLARDAGRSTGRDLFDGALSGGAQALGVPEAGIIEGAYADIVSLDAADPALAGRRGDFLLDSWIFAGASVNCVWRSGKKCVAGGRHHLREPIRERYRRTMMELLA